MFSSRQIQGVIIAFRQFSLFEKFEFHFFSQFHLEIREKRNDVFVEFCAEVRILDSVGLALRSCGSL